MPKKINFKTITSCMLLTSAVLLSLPCQAAERAETPLSTSGYSIISPYWNNASDVTVQLKKSSDNFISATARVVGLKGTTYSNGTVTLDKIVGTNTIAKRRWSGLSSSSQNFIFNEKALAYESGTYRISITITATLNGKSEVITKSQTFVL